MRKLHSVGWDTVCRPKPNGGLGLRKFRDFNRSLLAKLLWCIYTDPGSLWVQQLKSKYNVTSLDPSLLRTGSQPSPIWRSICWSRDLISKGQGKGVLSGFETLFWTEHWLGETSLLECTHLPPPSQLELSVRAS